MADFKESNKVDTKSYKFNLNQAKAQKNKINMKNLKKKEFAIIPTKVKMATKVNKPFINAISMNEPMKVVMDFGCNKTEYDELPSGRKYLTPSEIVAIQELNLDEKSPFRNSS